MPDSQENPTPMDEDFVLVPPTAKGVKKEQEDEDIDMADLDAATAKPDVKRELEDLFPDEDSDEEFPSTANPVKQEQSALQALRSSPVHHSQRGIPNDLMRIFYQRFFPWRLWFQWLNHSPIPDNDFQHREFSLWLPNQAVMRYQSYRTHDMMRQDVLRLMPTRIEIGPIYTANPRDRKSYRNSTAFRPIEKELCFDIDLTDYDDVRTCCDKANICLKCWQFITMAVKVIDTGLREDFGYEHILWVYSGRRGAHAWVCDRKARQLDDRKRKAIAGYFVAVKGGKESGKRVNLRRPLHPHLARSLDILKEHFQYDILEQQDPWRDNEQAAHLLSLLPDIKLREALRKKWDDSPDRSSSEKWKDIDKVAKTLDLDTRALLEAKQDIVLEYTYPRLDVVVSQQLTHLLKSPFVVHPGTGRVCVPINRNKLEEFDPLNVPTVAGMVREVDSWQKGGDDQEDEEMIKEGGVVYDEFVPDWDKTSLKPYMETFRTFVGGLLKEEKRVKREREEGGGGGSLDF
ncbi:eukaryotic and archaeal DNA primase small subunit [Podospora fimiseda]|uniref:DNA primase n=1 Tax=Podospora fimiseda TaxID=252190 RepID=A0AAN7BQM8_9PEZI|nr:eukaryotic and archaeal DNA primase small subunit [Podospora fimiseda]